MRQLDKRNQEIMSLKEKILQLEGKVLMGEKNEATEAIEENPYDSRGIQEEYVGHKQDPELVGLLKEITQNCALNPLLRFLLLLLPPQIIPRSFGKGMFGTLAGGLKMKSASQR